MASPSVEELQQQFHAAVASASSPGDLKTLRDQYLSRKHGLVTLLVKSIATAPPDVRRTLGAAANTLKKQIEEALDARVAAVLAAARPKHALAVPLPSGRRWVGGRHPG